MKYAVDEIIDNTAILENLDTKEKIKVKLSEFSFRVKEGNILRKKDTYELDKIEENRRRRIIQNKLNQLKREFHE